MEPEARNIYQKARGFTRYTQEGWAEILGISVDSVKRYESSRALPPDEVALQMAIICNENFIAFEHLRLKSQIAARILPDLGERVSLPKAVLNLMIANKFFQDNVISELMMLAADGKITEDEKMNFQSCVDQMEELTKCMYAVKYAKEDP